MNPSRIAAPDRRRHQRYARPIDGTWQGASIAGRCRISDISIGGCFVQSLVTPTPGELTSVTLGLAGQDPLVLAGRVVYVEANMGFAMSFETLSESARTRLERFLE